MSKAFKVTMAVILGVVAYAAYAIWDEPATITVDVNTIPEADRPAAASAASQLFATCSGLKAYGSEIERVEASLVRIDPELVPGTWGIHERYGWQEWIDIEIELADDISTPRDWAAWGHHLFYSVGPDGIVVNKDLAGRFCGIGERTGLVAFR